MAEWVWAEGKAGNLYMLEKYYPEDDHPGIADCWVNTHLFGYRDRLPFSLWVSRLVEQPEYDWGYDGPKPRQLAHSLLTFELAHILGKEAAEDLALHMCEHYSREVLTRFTTPPNFPIEAGMRRGFYLYSQDIWSYYLNNWAAHEHDTDNPHSIYEAVTCVIDLSKIMTDKPDDYWTGVFHG